METGLENVPCWNSAGKYLENDTNESINKYISLSSERAVLGLFPPARMQMALNLIDKTSAWALATQHRPA